MIYYEKIVDEKDLEPLVMAEKNLNLFKKII